MTEVRLGGRHVFVARLHGALVPLILQLKAEGRAVTYVGHVSRTVHRIYQRLVPADLAGVESALNFGPPPRSD